MIPKQLKLQNFLSYREVVLDFDGLHVACVCGPNGAGKSSLLEAIAWCVWGQSRVNTEDDIVRQGAIEAQVSFCFVHDGQCYRIIRTRRRQQASTLEFQIQMSPAVELGPKSTAASASSLQGKEPTFRSLTQKGVRATQQYILRQLKIDYETFVNAAYLRQGRADEFMLKRPGDRKQVLADLLKLDRYDQLAEQAK
ncbi:MAG: SMC family ATPase, partial [Phormidesmis sp.]